MTDISPIERAREHNNVCTRGGEIRSYVPLM
jgi:hypothetical protein